MLCSCIEKSPLNTLMKLFCHKWLTISTFADIRQMAHVQGKSINLALSVRGLTALDQLGLGDHMRNDYGIPMHARMIHKTDGDTYPVPYGKDGQCILSVGRRYMNEILLTGE